MSKSNPIVVAIDGPSASGKSTVSRRVAEQLGFVHVDSGAFYRGLTWKAYTSHIDVTQAAAVVAMVKTIDMQLHIEQGAIRFTIDGTAPAREDLRSKEIVERVSDVAAIPDVRSYVVDHLRQTIALGDMVMEGRDIGTVVFPETPFKFYLDADPEERARRRHKEMRTGQSDETVDAVLDSLKRRDQKDTTRKTAPLQIAEGAAVINTTGMSIDDVVAHIVASLRSSGVLHA